VTTPKHDEGAVLPDLGGWISGPCAAYLEATPCEGGAVDVRNSREPGEVLHVQADEFAAFVLRVRAGMYDHLLP
jgi:Domain of unknown function (DUF397)